MGNGRGRIIGVIIVAMVVAFAAQTALKPVADATLWSAVVTLIVMIAACAIAAHMGKENRTLLRLAQAAAADEPVDEAEARAQGPLGEAIYAIWKARKEKSYWYESILNTIPYVISVTDMNMNWTFCNKAALDSMGKRLEDCLGRHCSEKRGKNCGTPDCGIEQLRRGVNDLVNVLPNGHVLAVDLHFLEDREGRKIGHVELSRDITDEVRLKREANEASRRGRLDAVERLSVSVDSLNDVASRLMEQIGHVKEQTADASSRLAEAAAAMEEMNSTVLEVAKNAEDAAHASASVQKESSSGSGLMDQTVENMRALQTRSEGIRADMAVLDKQARDIGEVLTIIRDIADQTNLLALNAAIEAARAGDAGRGFAVVADEVRKLAEKTMNATKDVDKAVGAIQSGTDKSAQTVQDAVQAIEEAAGMARQSGVALNAISDLANDSSNRVQAIAAAATQQSAASEQINRNVSDVNSLSLSIARSMETAVSEVDDMLHQARSIHDVLEEIRATVAEEERVERERIAAGQLI